MIRKKEDALEVLAPTLSFFIREQIKKKFADKQTLDVIKTELLNDAEFLAQIADIIEARMETKYRFLRLLEEQNGVDS